ncbi:MAG: hypothetical protein RIS76_1092 [Verrucomicrobiota bacterium]|jgi:hypothetical protein
MWSCNFVQDRTLNVRFRPFSANRDQTFYFANNNARHFAFNAGEHLLPAHEFADGTMRIRWGKHCPVIGNSRLFWNA